MYLKNGKPAGYDVELVNALAKAMGVKLEDPEPRLQRPDPGPRREEVRHGLGRPLAHARAQEGDRASAAPYVPYALILAVPDERHDAGDVSRRGTTPSKTITVARRARPREQLVQTMFPKAKLVVVPGPERRRSSQVATGRANAASWSRTTCSRSSTSRTGTSSRRSAFKKPLHVRVRLVGGAEGQRRPARAT